MAFNLATWSRRGRDFSRGAPPPPGSVEWAAAGYVKQDPPLTTSADLRAVKRWVASVDDQVRDGRQSGKLTDTDVRDWEALLRAYRPLAADLSLPGKYETDARNGFPRLCPVLDTALGLAERFARSGARTVPLPYAGELLVILRGVPKQATTSEMVRRLTAGARCGEKLLDKKTPWWTWVGSRDHAALADATTRTKNAARHLASAKKSDRTYGQDDALYVGFMRVLTRLWVEAAALSGIVEPRTRAREEPEEHREREAPTTSSGGEVESEGRTSPLWVLAAAGVGYLGISWLGKRWLYGSPQKEVVVGVPDAIPREETIL